MHGNNRCLWHCLFCSWLLLIANANGIAGETGVRSYHFPDQGSLEFQVPADWEDQMDQPSDRRLPPTIRFMQRNGAPFVVLVTPVWPLRNARLPDRENLYKGVQESADRIRSKAIEKTIGIKEFIGSSAYGYYFSATDPAPKPGEFKYMTQGHIRAGPLMLIFTILTNDGQDEILSSGLALMKSAKPGKGALPSPSTAIEIIDAKGLFSLTTPASRLVLTIPKGNLSRITNPLGVSDHPRYFYFRDEQLQLNISGWFEPGQAFLGIKKHWENETSEWKRRGHPAPLNVSFQKMAHWDIVAYDIPYPSGNIRQSHLRAHWLQRGTWIEVHMSMTSVAPSTEIRTKLMALLKKFTIEEKKYLPRRTI